MNMEATESQEDALLGSNSGKHSMQSTGRLNCIVPGDHDVLCSQSRVFYDHTGNVVFRDIIARNLLEYAQAKTKSDKTYFFRHVVNEISSLGGKFLKLVD